MERLEEELARTKAELARKNGIIEALQKRIFGSSSERLDPNQLQLLFDEVVLGKPAAPPERRRAIRTGGAKSKSRKKPPQKG